MSDENVNKHREEKDVADFNDKHGLLEAMERARMRLPIDNMHTELHKRSAIYLEFMAAAFMKETGLNASEIELVTWYDPTDNAFHWKYKKSGQS